MRSPASAVVTGFYVGWPETRNNEFLWREWSDEHANSIPVLRQSVEAGRLVAAQSSEYSQGQFSQQNAAFLHGLNRSCGELRRLGLTEKSGLTLSPERAAICFSTSKAEPNSLLWEKYPLPACDVPAAYLSTQLGATGPMFSPVAACATGAHAIAIGAQLIEDGYADVVFCGALENSLSPLMLTAYRQLGALSKSGVMRPFEQKRDGFMPREGLAFLVLEHEKLAKSRGVKTWARVVGSSMNADATAMTSMCPSGESIALAIETALRKSGNPLVDYINAHGTATPLNDTIEARALELCIRRNVLAEDVAISSTKPLSGHWMGAAGALEAILSIQAMHENFALPTLNLENCDADVQLNLILGRGKDMPIERVLSLSYGFGGHIGVLVLERVV